MRIIIFFFLIAGLLSCALPVQVPVTVPEVTKDELFGVLAENAESFASLKGIARISFQEKGRKTVRVKSILLVEQPHRVRSEILGFFGQPAAVAVVNGELASLLVPGEGVLYKGGASARNLQRVLRIPLEIKDLINFILYRVPVIEYQDSNLEMTEEGRSRLLLKGKGDLQEELLFNTEQKLVEARLQKGEEEILKLSYGNFTEGGNPFPRLLVLNLPSRGVEARIEFSSLETNVGLDEKLFHLKKPEGFQIRQLPDRSEPIAPE
ncbi:MAG: DUF4292 domain-containing protein [Deltaproteobacteria bacterium]|nr:DUF4292 domain-containing protein [Deltaproteobacteria bacterium]